MIEDRPTDFGGYRPRNFDMSYQGDVSVRQALQLSLNVPAVRAARRCRSGPADRPLPPGRRHAGPAARRAARPGDRPRRRRHHAARSRPALYRACQWRQGASRCMTAPSRPSRARRRRRDARRPGRLADRRHPVRRQAAGRRAGSAASPTRPAPATATATPGRSASTAAMCSASGSAGPTPARCLACPAMSRPRPILFEGFAKSGLAAVPLRPAAGRRIPSQARGIAGHHGALRRRRERAGRRRADRTGADRSSSRREGARVDLGAGERQRLRRWC